MNDIAPIHRSVSPAMNSSQSADRAASSASQATRANDRVEVSVAAQFLSKLSQLPDVRTDLVERVRSEIANGTYETPDKLDAAIDELAGDLAEL